MKRNMEEETESLESQLSTFRKDSNDVLKAVRLLEDDIRQIKNSIQSTEEKISKCSAESDVFQVRIALLNSRSKNLNEKNLISESLTQRMRQRSERWKRVSRNEDKTYYRKKNGKEAEPKEMTDGLESYCNRDIRLACEQIIALRKQQLLEDLAHSGRRDQPYEASRDQLWTKIEEILKNSPPNEILTSICQNTKSSSNALLSKSRRIDLIKDAEDLRFKFESGKLKDVSEQPLLLRSVDQLIDQGQAAHYLRFLESEKSKNDTWKEKKRFEKTQQHLNNILEKKYGSKTRELPLKIRVIGLETELYGIKASTAYIKDFINNLKSQRKEKQKADESLQSKYRMIQQFETEAQHKQLMIQTLVKQNGSAKNRLEHQKNELLNYLERHVCSLGKEIDSMVDEIEEKIAREMELFAEMRISQLKVAETQSGSRVPCEEMSIHRLDVQSEDQSKAPVNAALKEIAEELQFPTYLAPENLLKKITEVKEQGFNLTNTSNMPHGLINDLDADVLAKKLTRLKETCAEIGSFNEKDDREALPVVHQSLSKATDALKECLHLEQMVNVWWNQPAQFLLPWVKEDGLNLMQWHTQWEVNSARLSQFQITR